MRLATAVLLAGACSDGPTGVDDEPASIRLAGAPSNAYSGEAASLAFLVRSADGQPVQGAAVALEALQGTVARTPVTTDAEGTARVTWQLADVDRLQTLRVRSGAASLNVAIHTAPLLTDLVLQGMPQTMALGETSPTGAVRGVTSTGRDVVAAAASLTVESEMRRYADLPVGEASGARVRAVGPGTMQVRAALDGLLSGGATVEVPPGRPIAVLVTPTELPDSGGDVVIQGYDLDGVASDAVRVDGVVVEPTSITAREIRLRVPGAPPGCGGRELVPVDAAQAFLPRGPLSVHRRRAGAVELEPGVVRLLGRGSELCVPFRGAADAEYVLAYFDTRGVESARSFPEDPSLDYRLFELSVLDESVPLRAPVERVGPAGAGVADPGSGATGDVVLPSPEGPLRAVGYDDLWTERKTPWAVGDTFAIWGGDGKLSPGVIFLTRGRFAVGWLARDSLYRIPARVRDLEAALDSFTRNQAGFLGRVFGVDWPVTTSGSDQVLVLVGDFFAPGLMMPGTGLVDRGSYVAVDPAVAESPLSDPLYFSAYTLFHEMAHAYQDRHMMKQCVAAGDCGGDMWSYRWAVEGGADFLTQQMMRVEIGYTLGGNYPLDGPVARSMGGTIYWGQDLTPHYGFSEGYGSASWLMTDLMHRAIAAGSSYEDAIGAIAIGALEGWFGNGREVTRTGLANRMRSIFGPGWEPAPAALQALLALGADDRATSADLQVPYVLEAWRHLRPGGQLRLGEGTSVRVQARGLTFAHYDVRDPTGLGGTLHLSAGDAELDWAIVRVR